MAEAALRLYPTPARGVPPDGIYTGIVVPPPGYVASSTRPYVVLNAVASIDGRTSVGGKSARIGSDADRTTMRTLRSKADAVLIGANTLRAEKLSLGLDGLSAGPEPTAVIVSTSANDVPLETNLISPSSQEVVVVVADDAPGSALEQTNARPSVLRMPRSPSGGVDLGLTLAALKTRLGAEVVVVEGGPRLNHSLVSAGLADELFLTLSPKLIGGRTPGASALLGGSELHHIPNLRLLSVHLLDHELFLRYSLPTRHNTA